ncbi:MAG: alpha/beta fold hydrolase [Betaproteobacteria bacterium]|nr:alpha/beta fold hydrolase [Betaproteobacteria bacterium]
MYKRIFYPDNIPGTTPELFGLDYESVRFNSEDGTRLTGWFLPAATVASPKDAKGTVIHMHSNSGNISSHWHFAGWLPDQGYNVLVFDYRGFGKSFGKAEPKGILEDAVAAITYVRSRTDIDTSKIFIYGQSLGGTLAIAAAAINPEGVRAVAVEAAFYSYSSIADERRPGEGYGLEPDDIYSASHYVSKLSPIPLLLIHGTGDSITSHAQSEQLFAEAKEPKRLELIKYGRHLDAMTERYGDHFQKMIMAFFESALSK